jgi:hypothetical protein
MVKQMNPTKKVFTLAAAFIATQKGEWSHDAWEGLLKRTEKAGVPVQDDESKRNLGNILEGVKFFYLRAHTSEPPAGKNER